MKSHFVAGEREGKVIAGVAVCAVGAMTSLLLLVIMYTHRNTHTENDEQNDQSLNLLQCSLRSPWQRQLQCMSRSISYQVSEQHQVLLVWPFPNYTESPQHSPINIHTKQSYSTPHKNRLSSQAERQFKPCVNGDVSFLWESQKFDPPQNQNP